MEARSNYWLRRKGLSRRTFLYGSGITAAGLLTSVACGGGDDDTTSGSGDVGAAGNKATATPLAVSTAQAKTGGTLNLMWATADAQLDPHSTTEHFAPDLYRAASHGLLKQESVTLNPAPDLATKWEKPDPLTLVFQLNPAAKWQNIAPVNGRPVTADDVVYSFKRISTPGPAAPRASSFSFVESFTATDKNTMTVKLKSPFVPILTPLSDKWSVIVAPEVVEKYGDLKRGESIVGFGPYIAQNADSSKGATLVRNPDYWGKKPYIDKVVYTTILDADARGAAFKSGQADISDVLPDLLADTFKANDVQIYEFDQVDVVLSLIGGPNDKAPLSDERVRRAINLVIDRTAMGQASFPGAKQKNAGLFSNPNWGVPEAEVAKLPGFGPKTTDAEIKEAKDLIAAAGVDGVEIIINTTKAYNAHHIDRAEALVPMLKRIGINLKLNVMEFAAMKDAETKKQLQFTAATYAAYGDPHTPLNNSFSSTGTRNYWSFADPAYDAMIAKEAQEEDSAKRHQQIVDIQKYMLKGTPVASDIWYQKSQIAVRKKVKNFVGTISAGSSTIGWYLADMWLDA
ncbi:MAG: ABC transporter substrate-binding protein [Chloroflexi bacterium]|nr:ABC transporter substrate-binding protein [Chloroflexota bacterium]